MNCLQFFCEYFLINNNYFDEDNFMWKCLFIVFAVLAVMLFMVLVVLLIVGFLQVGLELGWCVVEINVVKSEVEKCGIMLKIVDGQ